MLSSHAVNAACLPCYASAYQRKRRGADDDELADIDLEIAPGRTDEAIRAPTDPVLPAY
jgi:hypothetical protein